MRTASCVCGQLKIEVEGEPRGVGVCHCLACQQRTGSVFAALAGFAPPYRVTGRATEYVRTDTEEGFEARGVSVAVGAFADPAFLPPTDAVYECRRHPWVELPAGLQRFERDPP
jgi:hypothetical protein